MSSDVWLRLESLERNSKQRKASGFQSVDIAHKAKKSRMECREIEDKHVDGQKSKEKMAGHQEIVRLLKCESCSFISVSDAIRGARPTDIISSGVGEYSMKTKSPSLHPLTSHVAAHC